MTESSPSEAVPERARSTAKRSESRQRTALVGVRLSPDEHLALLDAAVRLSTTPAALLRTCFLHMHALDQTAQEAHRG